MIQKLTFSLLFFFITFFALKAVASERSTSKKITQIAIQGNDRTKDFVIHHYMGITVGSTVDTLTLQKAHANLLQCGLFEAVQLYPIPTVDGYNILVIVKEPLYFTLGNVGGTFYSSKYTTVTTQKDSVTSYSWYQKISDRWLYAQLGFKFLNVRGRAETVDVSLGLWRKRHIGLSWYKPFLGTKYFMKAGNTIGHSTSSTSPSEISLYNTAYVLLGRSLFKRSRIYGTLIHSFQDFQWNGGNGTFIQQKVDQSKIPELLNSHNKSMSPDEQWVIVQDNDTLLQWVGKGDALKHYNNSFSELFLTLTFLTDSRNSSFNPNKGYYYITRLVTNGLYPYKDFNDKRVPYIRWSNDFRFFHRGIFKSHSMAYRVKLTNTIHNQGNFYNRLTMGGESSLRGYGSGTIGGGRSDNRLLASTEYRFKIWKTPNLELPFLSWYDKGLNKFYYQFDGAFFADYGHLWDSFAHPLTNEIKAFSVGAGIRMLVPVLRRSVSTDFAWRIYPREFHGSNKYKPIIHTYLDFPF